MVHHANLCLNSLNSVEYSVAPQSDSIDQQPDQLPDDSIPNFGKKKKRTRLKKRRSQWFHRFARFLCFLGSLLIIGTVIRCQFYKTFFVRNLQIFAVS
jgi:hypothetical protein